MNSNRSNITRKGQVSLIVSFALFGSAFLLAAMALQSSPTGPGVDPTGPAALIVTTTDDIAAPDGKISLREAITTANSQAGMGTITFNIPATESGCTAANVCTITLTAELPAINDNVTIDGLPNNGHITVSGNNSVRGFLVNPAKTFNVQNLTIANGKGNDCPPFDVGLCGGAIQINGGTVNAANITVMGNTAQTRAGGIGVFGNGRLNLTNSTFFGNSSNEGGGIYSLGMLQVTNSTLSGNSAIAGGGGIVNAGTATLKNSIIANSTRGNCADGTGMLTADSHNLDTDGTCSNAATGSPNLQPLADNGGPTMTMALKLPSAAVDTGDNAVAAAPPVNNRDQRGVTRPQDGNNDGIVTSDIGAYELTGALVVTTTADVIAPDGKTSLREAITNANNQAGADTITFNIPASEGGCSAANACTITLATELPAINGDLTIDGLPNNGHITINGNHSVRGFLVNPGKTFNVQNLTIANGKGNDCPGSGATACGGGIHNNDGTVNVANVTLSGNTADQRGGAIYNSGALNVTASTFESNSTSITAGGTGGGISNETGTTANVSNSTFFNNSALFGGGIQTFGTLTVTNSTFSDNSAMGIGAAGGGIDASFGMATLKNSIVANSSNGGDCSNDGGTLTTDSHNLDTDGTCGNATTTTTAQINLQPLADNGGPTQTMALALPSAAVDTGDDAVAAAPPVNNKDQRGVSRPKNGNDDNIAVSDIGAYELADTGLIVTTTDDVISADGKTSLREAITNANFQPDMDTITFNIPASESGCAAANVCTITLVTELPHIASSVTIDGAPNNGHITLDGNHTVRSGFVVSGATVKVQNLTLANGNATDCPIGASGTCGGAIYVGGSSLVNAVNMTVMGNTAQFGGAIFVYRAGSIFSGALTVTNSTFFGNSASQGGSLYVQSSVQVANSTFSGNSATAGGGAIFYAGGSGGAPVKNSIIANNTGGDCFHTTIGDITADGFNLDTDGTCGNATTKTAAEINLQPLADNGGPTMTMALQLPSAAVDTGDNAVAAAPPVNNMDQRGVARPIDGDNNGSMVTDVGAFELLPSQCVVCHKHVTLILPCNSLAYRGHLDHGDPPTACPPPVLEKRK